MYFPLRPQQFDAIVDFYNQHGFVVLTDVDPALATGFRRALAEITGLGDERIRNAGSDEAILRLTSEARARLARPEMTPELCRLLLGTLGELVMRLLGPFVHVSNTFHPQIKRTESKHILNGYSGDGLEVEAPYGLHQDFTAARVATSPNAIVCWIPVNTCEYSALRVYSDTVRRGMLTNRWLRPEATGVESIGPFVDVKAREGHVLLFNFLVMHMTTLPGPGTRVSCDARLFPFCGILDSEATVMGSEPIDWIRRRLSEPIGETIAAPLYETLAYLGESIEWPDLRPLSALHWARYIEGLVGQNAGQMRDAIEQFANVDGGFDQLPGYIERFLGVTLKARPYRSIAAALPPADRIRCEMLANRAAKTAPTLSV